MRQRSCVLSALLLLISLSAVATEQIRPHCSRGRHPNHAIAQARQSGDASQRANEYIGDKRQLVFLVDFTDLAFTDAAPATLWNKIFNQENFQETPFRGSVHDYFYDQSFGQFNLLFDLYYVHMDKAHRQYRSGDIDEFDDTRAGLLLTEILDMKKGEITDWSAYDWDNDGYVNQVFILFAGKGQNDGGDENTIWAHQWKLSEQSLGPYSREWGHVYTVTGGGKDYLIDNYAIFPELTGSGTYGTFGTLCHEYGHCLGLPDFYYGSTSYVGEWDIMDCGNYNEGGYCPPGYSAHEKMYLGWLTIPELTEATTITGMGSISNGQKEAYLIRNDGYSDEYYIIENRQQTGWDSSLPGSGIVVFHVDFDETSWKSGTPNSYAGKRYTIIPANNKLGTSYQSRWAYPYNGNNVLTNGSSPAASLYHKNTDGTTLMNKPVTEMSVEGGLASFKFMGGTTGILEKTFVGQSKVLYDLGPVYIIRNAQGEIKKVIKH
ncbi:MAG: M6 family metalloprotease domain-containing protein [Prevotella sp.]|nr:M6 family metalloprotease domain-containing protein [Prevotella sp.]